MASKETEALIQVVLDARSRSNMYWAWYSALRADNDHASSERIFQMYEEAASDLSNALEMYFDQTQKEHQT